MFDTQGIKSCWPGFGLFDQRNQRRCGQVDSKFIEHVAPKLMLICVDCEHRLKPDRRSKIVLLDDRNRRRLEEALIHSILRWRLETVKA